MEQPTIQQESPSCGVSRPRPIRYVLAAFFFVFGALLAVKAVRTSDAVTGVIAVVVLAYATLRALGRVG
jgi:hypothetical protein